jgi:hypothetical protein
VVIDNLDIVGIVFLPDKTNSKPVIDSHAILTLPVAFQGFQAITRRAPQILEGLGGI